MKKIVFFKQGRLRIVSLVVLVFFEVVLAPLHDSKKEKDKREDKICKPHPRTPPTSTLNSITKFLPETQSKTRLLTIKENFTRQRRGNRAERE